MPTRACTAMALAAAIAIPTSGLAQSLDGKPEPSPDLFHPKPLQPTPEAPPDQPFAEHFLVLQLSRGGDFGQTLILNNAANALAAYGPDQVVIEIVTYGPGLKLLFKENDNADRIQSLADQGVRFSACANTMQALDRGPDSLHPAAAVVSGGVTRINELSRAGWTYIRP